MHHEFAAVESQKSLSIGGFKRELSVDGALTLLSIVDTCSTSFLSFFLYGQPRLHEFAIPAILFLYRTFCAMDRSCIHSFKTIKTRTVPQV